VLCTQWYERELANQSGAVVTLDATAAQSVFGKITPINKSRGRLITWPTDARRW
jgi:DNA polymerase